MTLYEFCICTIVGDLLLWAALAFLLRRTRRAQRLMHEHMKSDHTHLLVTEELMQRVADLDGKGLPKVVE